MASAEQDNPFLSCQICFEDYDSECHQPKLLPCHHGYCKECIAGLVGQQKRLRCPTCRKKFDLPPGGVDDLQTNFYIEDIGKILERISPETCKTHPGQALVSFCNSCQVALCYQCTRTDHKESKQHVHRELNDASKHLRQKVQEKVLVISQNIADTKQGLTHLAKCKEKMLHDKIVAEREIDLRYRQAAKEILAAIKDRWCAVRKQNEDMCGLRMNELTAQIKETEEKLLSLENIKDAFNAAVSDKHNASILNIASKDGALYSVDNVLERTTFSKTVPQLRFNEGIWLYATKRLVSTAGGQILSEDELGVNISQNQLEISPHPTPGMVCTVSLTLSKRADISINIFDTDGDPVDYTMEQQGKYFKVQFIPQIPGIHRAEVKHGGQIINGGDITIDVDSNNPINTIGSNASLNRPRSVALDSQTNIYIADMGNNCIVKQMSGSSIPVKFCSTSSFDIVIDIESNELLCTRVTLDSAQRGWSNTVEVYSLDGVLRQSIENEHASRALWVAVNSRHQILTADSQEHVIFVHGRQGKLLKTIGRYGSKVGKFNGPAGICIGPNDDIIVADRGNKRVQILDSNGTFKTQIGHAGTGKGEFQCPIGVAIDKQNVILVSDWKCNRIQLFNYDGSFVAWIDSSSNTLDGPTGMTLTPDGQVLVADCKNHCIKKFRYKELPDRSLMPGQCCIS